MESIPELLTAKDIQRILKCSLPLIYKLAERGQLPCVRWSAEGPGTLKPRTVVRFKKSDVLAFIEDAYNHELSR